MNKLVTDLLGEVGGGRGDPARVRGLLRARRRPTPTRSTSSRAGVPTGLISIPTRYLHSPNEICDLADVEVDHPSRRCLRETPDARPVVRPLTRRRAASSSARCGRRSGSSAAGSPRTRRPQLGGVRDRAALAARRHRAARAAVRDHGPGAAGRRRPGARAPGGDRRGAARSRRRRTRSTRCARRRSARSRSPTR